MAFDKGQPNEIIKYTYKSGQERTAWDAAHGTGDALWRDNMQGCQNKLDPGCHFKFDQNARWNGAPVSYGTKDAGIAGATAHGGHGVGSPKGVRGPIEVTLWDR